MYVVFSSILFTVVKKKMQNIGGCVYLGKDSSVLPYLVNCTFHNIGQYNRIRLVEQQSSSGNTFL